jgi:hypothetical protein
MNLSMIYAIDGAAVNVHINILEWFHNSEYEFKYSFIGNNKITQEWFIQHGYTN